MKIALIRADGSKSIGMGHLNRSCLLSDMLKDRFGLTTKLIMKKDSAAQKFLAQRETETILLPETISITKETDLLGRIVKKELPELFVLDVLEHDINPAYMEPIRRFGIPIVAITDDSYRRELDADIVVNGNPGQIGLDYSNKSGRYLLGPNYFIMDPAHGGAGVKIPNGDISRILISLGGTDHNDLLFRLLGALDKGSPNITVLLISTKASGYLGRLQEYFNKLRIKVELKIDVPSLAPFWCKCDLAITAGGNTLFERIASRLPGATICQLKRQMEIAENFQRWEVNCNLGFGPDITDKDLLQRTAGFIGDTKLHCLQYQKAPQTIGGNGLRLLGNEIRLLLERRSNCHEL